jgi:hypothetical protein
LQLFRPSLATEPFITGRIERHLAAGGGEQFAGIKAG